MSFLDGLEKNIEKKSRNDNEYSSFLGSVNLELPDDVVKKCIEVIVDEDSLSKEIFKAGVKKAESIFSKYYYEFEFKCNFGFIDSYEKINSNFEWVSKENGIAKRGNTILIANIKQIKPICDELVKHFVDNKVVFKSKEFAINRRYYNGMSLKDKMFAKKYLILTVDDYKYRFTVYPIGVLLKGVIKCDKEGKLL